MTSRSRRRKTTLPPHRDTPILLTDIRYDSTCIKLNLPESFACSECKNQLSVVQNTRKKRKTNRQKCDRRQCQQYWCSKYGIGYNSTEGHAIMHRNVRSYLRIEQEVEIKFDHPYCDKTDTRICEHSDTDQRSSVPVISKLSYNSAAFDEQQIPVSVKQLKKIDSVDDGTVNNTQSLHDKLDSFLKSEFPRNHKLSREKK